MKPWPRRSTHQRPSCPPRHEATTSDSGAGTFIGILRTKRAGSKLAHCSFTLLQRGVEKTRWPGHDILTDPRNGFVDNLSWHGARSGCLAREHQRQSSLTEVQIR